MQCDNCGNCEKFVYEDITIEAQKILSAVLRSERKFGIGLTIKLTIDMLIGAENDLVDYFKLNEFSTYGIMKDLEPWKIREYIDYLKLPFYICVAHDRIIQIVVWR